ncbi:MAG: PLP-dependent aminotransferase family protein [Planctomycetes bacterium]|nr:PLP-dependent aminotransferase family protein [Planctomycetota bacterium]
MIERRFARRMSLVKPSAIRELLKLGADPEVIAFGGGFPDPELFPVEKLKAVFTAVMDRHGKQALQYATTEGLPSLREKLVRRMNAAGVDCSFDELVIIQGAQQSMDLVGKMFIDKGDTIVVERPTFLGALVAFNPFEPNYIDVPVDQDGMRMDELERVLKENPGVKLIYTIPEFQNPSGMTMSLERRKRLIELADQYDVMILEDSPYREIRYEGESMPLLKSLDTTGRVIHVGSFSKILCPGMRLGWMVGDKELMVKLCQLKMAADTQNSTLNMYAADTFLDMYDIDAHIEALRIAYKHKKEVMLGVIEKAFPKTVSHSNPQGGLFTWLTLPEGANAADIMRNRLLPEAKVAYVPGDSFFARSPLANHCRLNYSCMSEEKIVSGMTRMGEIFSECFG